MAARSPFEAKITLIARECDSQLRYASGLESRNDSWKNVWRGRQGSNPTQVKLRESDMMQNTCDFIKGHW